MEGNAMKLTTKQEEELLNHYDKLLWSVVHRFRRKHYQGYNNRDDLHSECVLVFIKHIRACKDWEEISRVPILDMVHAMCLYVLSEQALTYPKRTAIFRQVMDEAKGTAPNTENEKEDSYEPCNDALDVIAFRDFFAKLPLEDKKIVVMKLRGCKNRQIAAKLGVSDVRVTRMIKKLRCFYQVSAA